MTPSRQFLLSTWLSAIPTAPPHSVVEWAEQHVKLVGSARGDDYKADKTPWTREPLECANNGTRKMTFVKPVQSGGSTVGITSILFWLAHWSSGDIQYNWQNDNNSDARWDKCMSKDLKACAPVMARASADRFDWKKGLIVFPHCNFIMQGVFSDRAVASDTIRGQVNEEIHDEEGGWIPGRLEQAYARLRAVWNGVVLNISNAGRRGDQLWTAFNNGTQQFWEVKCPGCGQFHRLRMRWEPEKPTLGGLRYDSESARPAKDGGQVHYAKLLPSIRYQMPCGFEVRDVADERRRLSLSGRYSEPTNRNAPLTERSYTLEAVSVDYIPWIELIRQKSLADGARARGDAKPWLDYLRENECQFIGIEDRRPESVPIVLSTRKKDREGLPLPRLRLAQLDYQEGLKQFNETPHWWMVVQDFDTKGNSLIVWEGKCESEGEILDVLRRHEVKAINTAVDASWTGADRYVYYFCLKNGFNALKVWGREPGGQRLFEHADGVKRTWSEPEELWPKASSTGQQGPSKSDPLEEPQFWNISQAGALDALAHLRARKDIKYEIPADVSEDFKQHFLPWSLEEYKIPMTNQTELRWRKASEKAPDHLFMACSYLALWAEMEGATTMQDLNPDEVKA